MDYCNCLYMDLDLYLLRIPVSLNLKKKKKLNNFVYCLIILPYHIMAWPN